MCRPECPWRTLATGVFLTLTSAVSAIQITSQPAAKPSWWGANTFFSVTAEATGPLNYQWQFNGANLADNGRITGSAGSLLTLANVSTADAGDYRVVVANPGGSVVSSDAGLTVSGCLAPPAGLVSWWPADGDARDVIGGNNVTLTNGVSASWPGKPATRSGFTPTRPWCWWATPLNPALR